MGWVGRDSRKFSLTCPHPTTTGYSSLKGLRTVTNACMNLISDPPGPPINLKDNDTDKTSTRLTWKPPKFDGGSPITGAC